MPSRTIQAERTAPTSAVSRIGQRRQVVIPKKIFDALALAEGDFMEVTAENGRVAMQPTKPVDAGDTLTATVRERFYGSTESRGRGGSVGRRRRIYSYRSAFIGSMFAARRAGR